MQSYRLSYDKPHTRQKKATITIHLFSELILKFGFPRNLHSGNGMESMSKRIEHFTHQLSIKKTYISTHIPKPMENWNHHIDSLRLHLDILNRQYSRMGWITSICNCCIQLVPQWALPVIPPLFKLWMWPISFSPCSFLTVKTSIFRLRWRHDTTR